MFDLIIRNLTQRKLRAGLTVFGIALGIFAVVVMGAMSENFNLTFERSISLTADKIRVFPQAGFFGGGLPESVVREVKTVPGVADAYGIIQAPLEPGEIGFFGGNMVVGIPPEKIKLTMKDTKIEGRYLVPGDSYRAMLGSGVAREFNLKVGDKIEVKTRRTQRGVSELTSRNFTVVGIFEYTGSFFDNVVQIPLDRAQELYNLEKTVTMILAVPASNTDANDLARRIELSVKGISTISPEELRRQIEQALVVFTLITLSAAILAAIIGGLSVMNTMLMSVSERTREFGLLRALGAETKDILFMTMGEAAVMGVIGGVLGIIWGGAMVYYLNDYLAARGVTLFTITPRLLLIAIIFAVSLGVTSGTYPAYRAAKMSPMEALRHE